MPPALPKVLPASNTMNSVLFSFNNSDNFSFSDTNKPSHHNSFPSPYPHPGHPMCSGAITTTLLGNLPLSFFVHSAAETQAENKHTVIEGNRQK